MKKFKEAKIMEQPATAGQDGTFAPPSIVQRRAALLS
jgi:hypothetical protein